MILEGKPLPGVEIIKISITFRLCFRIYKINNMLIRRSVGQKLYLNFSSNSSTGNNPCNCIPSVFYII